MNKPIIRHCYNCKWCKRFSTSDWCEVKYVYIQEPRAKALICRHYKVREQNETMGKNTK